MKIDFNAMEAVTQPKFKGGEGEFIVKSYSDGMSKALIGRLTPGSSIGYHKHETNSETIFILEGNGKCIVEDGEEKLTAGDCHYCAKGRSHSLVNDSDADLVFCAVVPEQ